MPIPQYNATQYDAAQYNATALYFLQRLSDSQGSSDVEIGGEGPVRTEAIAAADVIPARSMTRMMLDSTVPVDVVSKQVTNKGLQESVKVRDWFIGDKNIPVDNWL